VLLTFRKSDAIGCELRRENENSESGGKRESTHHCELRMLSFIFSRQRLKYIPFILGIPFMQGKATAHERLKK